MAVVIGIRHKDSDSCGISFRVVGFLRHIRSIFLGRPLNTAGPFILSGVFYKIGRISIDFSCIHFCGLVPFRLGAQSTDSHGASRSDRDVSRPILDF